MASFLNALYGYPEPGQSLTMDQIRQQAAMAAFQASLAAFVQGQGKFLNPAGPTNALAQGMFNTQAARQGAMQSGLNLLRAQNEDEYRKRRLDMAEEQQNMLREKWQAEKQSAADQAAFGNTMSNYMAEGGSPTDPFAQAQMWATNPGMMTQQAAKAAFAEPKYTWGQPFAVLDDKGHTHWYRSNREGQTQEVTELGGTIPSSKQDMTALERNTDFVARTLKISPQDALKWVQTSKQKSKDQIRLELISSMVRSGMYSLDDATKEVDQAIPKLFPEKTGMEPPISTATPTADTNITEPLASPSSNVMDLPLTPTGEIDQSRLKKEQPYRVRTINGEEIRYWTGSHFVTREVVQPLR